MAVTAATAALPAAAASSCLTASETRAAQLRTLHVGLMVAALKCDGGWQVRDRYNAYVDRFGGLLSDNADVLRRYFGRAFGRERDTRFDRYMTRLANDASMAAPSTVEYCQSNLDILDNLLAMSDDDIALFASAIVEVPTESCAPGPRAEVAARRTNG